MSQLFQYPGKTCPSMHRDMHYKGMQNHIILKLFYAYTNISQNNFIDLSNPLFLFTAKMWTQY